MVTFFCMGAVVIVYHGEGEYSRVSISIVNGFLCRKWDSALIFIVPPLAGGRWCRRHQRGTGPLGPEGSGGGWRRKLRKRSAANAAGCAEGLCSLRSGSVRERLGVAAAPPQFLAAVWRSVLHSVISTCSVLHPLATSWPSSPKGDASFLPFTVVPLDEIKRNAQKKEAPWEELLFISGEIRIHSSGIRMLRHRSRYRFPWSSRRSCIRRGVLRS